jgi:hypothetical protein
MGIWKREQREEGEGPPTKPAKPPSDPNPVVVFIVRLLAAATMTDNGIAFTNRASAQQDVPAVARPVAFDLVRLDRKWDKNNRVCIGTLLPVDPPRSELEAGSLLLKKNLPLKKSLSQLEKNNASQLQQI